MQPYHLFLKILFCCPIFAVAFLMFCGICRQSWSDAACSRFMTLIEEKTLYAQITDIEVSRLNDSCILILRKGLMTTA